MQHLVDEHKTEQRKWANRYKSVVDEKNPGKSLDVEIEPEIVDAATGLGKSDSKFFKALAKDVLGR